MRYFCCPKQCHTMARTVLAVVMIALLGILTGCSWISSQMPKSSPSIRMTAESDETVVNWTQARHYQAEGRYELARQYYMLALSAVRTQSALEQLQRELYAVDMQIRTMR